VQNKLYTLFVAINDYSDPIKPLAGCRTDIENFISYLKSRVKKSSFNIETLYNENATREAVTKTLSDMIQRAEADDTFLFYFAGHGSQEPTPPPLWHMEPDKLNETLVCWDSRRDSWDIADKELSHMLALGNSASPHRLVILDCCHSGTGTRSQVMGSRQIQTDTRHRPLASYLFAKEMQMLRASGQKFDFAPTPHVLLAACRENERAYEYDHNGQPVGLFSHFLMETLTKSRADLCYQDIHRGIYNAIRRITNLQHPQLEATPRSDILRPIFGKVPLEPQKTYFTMSYYNQNWILDAGNLHGLHGGETTLTVFELDEPLEKTLNTINKPLIKTKRIEAHQTLLDIPDDLNLQLENTYKAVLVRNGGKSIRLRVENNKLADTIQNYLPDTSIIRKQTPAEWIIERTNDIYHLRHHDGNKDDHFSRSSLPELITLLLQVERWHRIHYLENVTPLLFSHASLQIECTRVSLGRRKFTNPADWTNNDKKAPYRIERYYKEQGANWQFPVYELRLTNTTTAEFHIAALLFHSDYRIQNLFPDGTYRLLPGQTRSIRMGGKVSDEKWSAGLYESSSDIKIILCTEEFDTTPLESNASLRNTNQQDGNGLAEHIPVKQKDKAENGKLHDWFTVDVEVVIIRPPEATNVSG
jgi:hypothetical protein